jgi:NADH:ubiquinone oxidoreductase subunit F (NADH-binding)/NADH:ubiquinone oxidoreductase subunit E
MSKATVKRSKFWRPKGRALGADARADIAALLQDQSPQRNLLIEYLHRIQDRFGCLRMSHLHGLADWMGVAPVEVYEVATFYHHFDVVDTDQSPPAKLTVRVCDSISCMLSGAETLIEQLEASPSMDSVRIQRVPCVGRCDTAPVAVVGQQPIADATLSKIKQAIDRGQYTCPTLSASLETYIEQGGYDYYRALVEGRYQAEEIIHTLEQADLRGLGGAGFPAGKKWRILSQQTKPRWIAVNIDEGEPGTFKDRDQLEQHPHALLEGLLIAARVIESEHCVLYVRDEYPEILQSLEDEIKALQEWAEFPMPDIELRRGAGAYICGEESAMLESIEGKRGLPRQRPPFIAERGLYGFPTLEHNAETLMWVPEILHKGVEWYQSHGANGRTGLRRYSLSGRINKPGVYLAPAGITLRELIKNYGGGMLGGHELYGYLPGGASGGILPASLADEPLDFDTLQQHGCFIGSAAVIVFSQQDKARDIALNAMRFFAHESCGQCTPCRVGTQRAADMMTHAVWPLDELEELACVMEDASICGLGQAAPNPMRCVVKYFPHEVKDSA